MPSIEYSFLTNLKHYNEILELRLYISSHESLNCHKSAMILIFFVD